MATAPLVKDTIYYRKFVCQIHARRQINIRAMQSGYLEAIRIKEGQFVKMGEELFKVIPTIYEAKYAADKADVLLAQIEYDNTKKLYDAQTRVVSQRELLEYGAKLAKAKAKLQLSEAELKFTTITAPFDGIIDRFYEQQGSLIQEGDNLTCLTDNSVMWVYFNVPEARYLDYMAELGPPQNDQEDYETRLKTFLSALNRQSQIELVLANGSTFPQTGRISAIEAKFNNETGNVAFRADFPNPNRLLRHGETGKLLIKQTLHNAIVIPVRATFQILDKRYVYVIGEDHVVRQREVAVQHEMDDIFIIKKGLDAKDKIVLDGVQQVRDGDKLEEFEFRKPEEVLGHQKFHAE
ncbi:efflux RND transporter periplasmic adaptor subunit [Fimbriiglobus ruber]|uniref:efflux RND transporter periplasmic adaptor subunit n=1 Tax=Fimbriiglobus ruber TaxID=1908690 RepID=UPI001EE75A89|nr:efflux RND transporter periplasmic adaptor subunit [Fimbriiglobus ruber]